MPKMAGSERVFIKSLLIRSPCSELEQGQRSWTKSVLHMDDQTNVESLSEKWIQRHELVLMKANDGGSFHTLGWVHILHIRTRI